MALALQPARTTVPQQQTELQVYQVSWQGKLWDALAVLNRSGGAIALVMNDDGRLVGTLTDGDVRRALLAGATLDAALEPFVCRSFISVPPSQSRGEVLDLMQAMSIRQVPVLDSTGRLVGLHLMNRLLGAVERPNWAVIMAGGRGTRLRPLTEHLPKPMIHVAGRPILERLMLHLVSYGFRRIFLSINYLGYMVENHFGDGSRFGCRIEYLREDRPLGTCGSLSLLPEQPTEPFVVMNGDLVTQVNFDDLLAFHTAGSQVATVGVKKYFHQVPYGCLDLQGDQVRGIVEKPCLVQHVNAGIYVLHPDLAHAVPCHQMIGMPELLEKCLEQQQSVKAYEIHEEWLDVGQREQLQQAQTMMDRRRCPT